MGFCVLWGTVRYNGVRRSRLDTVIYAIRVDYPVTQNTRKYRKYTYTYNLLMKSIKLTYITLPEKEEGKKTKMT